MEIKEFIGNFAAQFDETDASVFTAETKFKEIAEWSSLSALSIIAMVDEEYGVEISGNVIRNSSTIADLFEFVKSKAIG
jgi:acyl carrier protein